MALVLVGGAELFTGNNLIVIASASARVSASTMLRNCLACAGRSVTNEMIVVILPVSAFVAAGFDIFGPVLPDKN